MRDEIANRRQECVEDLHREVENADDSLVDIPFNGAFDSIVNTGILKSEIKDALQTMRGKTKHPKAQTN